jgi:hypothetical protein
LNLADGLECDIIRVIRPEWNGSQPTPPPATEPPFAEELAPLKGAFSFVLQPTYYGQGFFNVRVEDQHHLGADGEKIELFLGDNPLPILGTINRRANSNGTPRVMGYVALRDWFQGSAQERSTISVQVLSATSIRLKSPD